MKSKKLSFSLSGSTDRRRRFLKRKVKVKVLEKGYIKLVNNMGSDIDVVNSARVSFNKEVQSLSDSDTKLINFLIKHRHDSTLRHCVMTFEVYAPLMVARQWWKHHIGATMIDEQDGWNESSRRYITEEEEFYIPMPMEWRSAPENRKQGSGEPVIADIGAKYTRQLEKMVVEGDRLYKEALEDGIAPEQARLLLPAYSMYVRWRWTVSLNGVLHFISLRDKEDAQYEIREYASAINTIACQLYPITTEAWRKFR
jgi:thymidylate synthase (FAD)